MKYAPTRLFPVIALLVWMPFACNTEDSALDLNATGGSAAGGTIGSGSGTGGTLAQTGGAASGGAVQTAALRQVAMQAVALHRVVLQPVAALSVEAQLAVNPVRAVALPPVAREARPPALLSNCKGVCVAQDSLGCGGVWKCVNDPGVCTTDIAQFCGCDGKTFSSSSSCVPNAWAHRGSCEQGVDCDQRKIQCRAATPECAPGYVPSVVGICYGPCVKLSQCACTSSDQCPTKPSACSTVTNRCVAPVF